MNESNVSKDSFKAASIQPVLDRSWIFTEFDWTVLRHQHDACFGSIWTPIRLKQMNRSFARPVQNPMKCWGRNSTSHISLQFSEKSTKTSPSLRFLWSFINHREKLLLSCVTMQTACSGWNKVSLSLFTLYFVRKREKNPLWSHLIDHLPPPLWRLLKVLKADEKSFPTKRAWTAFRFKCISDILIQFSLFNVFMYMVPIHNKCHLEALHKKIHFSSITPTFRIYPTY